MLLNSQETVKWVFIECRKLLVNVVCTSNEDLLYNLNKASSSITK